MPEILRSSWLVWAIGVAVGLPVVLIALTELQSGLAKNGSRMARPVAMLRNYIVPSLALLLLLTQVSGLTRQVTVVRLVATVFAFLLMLFVLSGINLLLFGRAEPGSWRRRMPSIFIDIGRLVIVAIGLAVLLSQVWGADVGSLFTALGVTSIVIGLALQTAVGSIVAGLLLLFEQPFVLGDWLQTSSVKGRVVQVNWRSVHIDTGNAIHIIPNSSLAKDSFANLSQPTVASDETMTFAFAKDDSPTAVCALLEDVASRLPLVDADVASTAVPTGAGSYAITLHLRNLADADVTTAQMHTWVWYAARRAGLHLDGCDPGAWAGPGRVDAALRSVATSLMLSPDDAAARVSEVELQRFGTGEIVQALGAVPDRLSLVVEGRVALGRPAGPGSLEQLSTVETNGFVNPTALTREPATLQAVAAEETTIVRLPIGVVEQLVNETPALARDLSDEIDRRRALVEPSSSADASVLAGR